MLNRFELGKIIYFYVFILEKSVMIYLKALVFIKLKKYKPELKDVLRKNYIISVIILKKRISLCFSEPLW